MEPSYLALFNTGELAGRIKSMLEILMECRLCPRQCKVDRTRGKTGVCKAPGQLFVSSATPHFGEEAPLTGFHGSGTIFLTHCGLRCVFCQNYDISHLGIGSAVSSKELAGIMVNLQRSGCHNINFVTPTHYAPQILESLPEAIRLGLRVPLVWNCGGYESLEALRLLDGIVDIYMPDIKFGAPGPGKKYCSALDYPEAAFRAIKEMHRQVGDLQIDEQGIATRGLLVRHLVMPGGLAYTGEVVRFLADEISPHTYINIMNQYHPCYLASDFSEIARPVNSIEFSSARKIAADSGLYRGF